MIWLLHIHYHIPHTMIPQYFLHNIPSATISNTAHYYFYLHCSSATRKFHSSSLLQHFHWYTMSTTSTILVMHYLVLFMDSLTLVSEQLKTAQFVWSDINADVRCWTCFCIRCQHAKVWRHTTASFSAFPVPDTRFDIIHIGQLPSRGFTYHVDHHTRWPEAIPLTLKLWFKPSSMTGFFALVSITDCGRQFESRLWTNLMSLLRHQFKSKPQPNPDTWMDTLALVLLGSQTAHLRNSSRGGITL